MRGIEFGGSAPLFCIPLVANDLEALLAQARVAHDLAPDAVEWRADSYDSLSVENIIEAARQLRTILDRELILFTLRVHTEGGKREINQVVRANCIEGILRTGLVDLVDVELCNGAQFIEPIVKTARGEGKGLILSYHDFEGTPATEFLLSKISEMIGHGADIAKLACMPKTRGDVLRMLEATLLARNAFPATPLCTMSMGALGSLSRVAGFLYGSDMAFAVGQEISAPGQIPIAEARRIALSLLQYG